MLLSFQGIDLSSPCDDLVILGRFAVLKDHDGRKDQIIRIKELLIQLSMDLGDRIHRILRIFFGSDRGCNNLTGIAPPESGKDPGTLLDDKLGSQKAIFIHRLGISDKGRCASAGFHAAVQHIRVLRHLKVLLENGNAHIDFFFHVRILSFQGKSYHNNGKEVVKATLRLGKARK